MASSFSRETVFLLILSLLGEVIGNVFGLYKAIPAYDIVTHFIGGALVSSLIIKYFYEKLGRQSFFINVFFTMGVGALWEIFEFFADLLFMKGMQNGLNDTMVDLIMVTSAAIIINLIYANRYREPWVKK